MTQPPLSTPPPNGTAHPAAVQLRQEIRDRWGRPYELRGQITAAYCHFTLHTPEDRQIGQLVLEIAGSTGQLSQLQIADESAAWIPARLKRAIVRLLPRWAATGHRGRGLGALLVIYALKTACDLELNGVVAAGPLAAAAQSLLRDLGFALETGPQGVAGTYRISNPNPAPQ